MEGNHLRLRFLLCLYAGVANALPSCAVLAAAENALTQGGPYSIPTSITEAPPVGRFLGDVLPM